MSLDGIALGHELSALVKDYVRRATEPLVAEIVAMRDQIKAIPSGKDGRDGIDGKDASIDLEMVKALVMTEMTQVPTILDEKVKAAVDALPRPKDGIDGKNGIDGRDVDPEVIRAEVAKAVDAIPRPVDGKDGRDGECGKDGANGIDGKDADVEIIRAEVAKAVSGIPAGRDGRDADPAMVELLVKAAVDSIPKPKDGIDGKDGTNGVDGLSLKGMSASLLEDGQTVVFKYEDESRTLEAPIRFPVPVYKDVYSRDKSYLQGDSVTQDGGTFIALRDEPGPCPGDGWRCSVKRGRQGDRGEKGLDGKSGRDGRDGKDLTQMGPDGRKF